MHIHFDTFAAAKQKVFPTAPYPNWTAVGVVNLADPAALVMARTAGAFLLSVGILNFMVRADSASPTMVSILFANAMLQLFVLPIDPIAYFTGVYGNPMSFIPNTILHIGLLFGFAHFWRKTKTEIAANHAKIA